MGRMGAQLETHGWKRKPYWLAGWLDQWTTFSSLDRLAYYKSLDAVQL